MRVNWRLAHDDRHAVPGVRQVALDVPGLLRPRRLRPAFGVEGADGQFVRAGRELDVGSGRGVPIREVAASIADALGIRGLAPEVNGEFRPGEMRHLTSGTARIQAAGYRPEVGLTEGIGRYLDWIRAQSDVKDYFSEAAEILRAKGIVHRVASAAL